MVLLLEDHQSYSEANDALKREEKKKKTVMKRQPSVGGRELREQFWSYVA